MGRSAVAGDGVEAVAEAVRDGVDWIQLRERALCDRALYEWVAALGRALRQAAAESGRPVRIVVNRRVDVALASGADGAHLGFDAMTVAQARQLLGRQALVGVSAHAVEEVERAAAEGASYAHLAPIYAPNSKAATRPPLGLETLARAARAGLPVLAQGGIDARLARDVVEAGAAGVAVTGAIVQAADPRAATRALREALDATGQQHAAPQR